MTQAGQPDLRIPALNAASAFAFNQDRAQIPLIWTPVFQDARLHQIRPGFYVVDIRDLPDGNRPDDDLFRYVSVTAQGRAFITLREQDFREQGLKTACYGYIPGRGKRPATRSGRLIGRARRRARQRLASSGP